MRRTKKPPPDDGYGGCGTTLVLSVIGMFMLAAGLSFCGWEP